MPVPRVPARTAKQITLPITISRIWHDSTLRAFSSCVGATDRMHSVNPAVPSCSLLVLCPSIKWTESVSRYSDTGTRINSVGNLTVDHMLQYTIYEVQIWSTSNRLPCRLQLLITQATSTIENHLNQFYRLNFTLSLRTLFERPEILVAAEEA